jgi:AcrR family transcriptional regulator
MEQLEQVDIKKKILKAAENLFMKYGVRSISMDDISRHLAVSKKTLYQHFADKEDIVPGTHRNDGNSISGDHTGFQKCH